MEKLIKINEEGGISIFHMPFDEVHGLGKTEAELLQEGYLVESIPEPEQIAGKAPVMKFDKVKNEVYYEYVDFTPPKTPEQEIAELKAQLTAALGVLDEIVLGGM